MEFLIKSQLTSKERSQMAQNEYQRNFLQKEPFKGKEKTIN